MDTTTTTTCRYCGKAIYAAKGVLAGTWLHRGGSAYCDASATAKAAPR